MKKNALTFKIFLMIVMTDIGESIAELAMKKGLIQTGINYVDFNNLFEFLSRNAGSYLIWLAVLVYIINFFIWITVLSRAELSVAFPVGSTSYILVPLLAVLFLNETVTPVRWLGVIFIIAGIGFVSKSSQRERAAINKGLC